jgi:hypothetical protein
VERKGRSAAEVCTSEARKIGETPCARERGRASLSVPWLLLLGERSGGVADRNRPAEVGGGRRESGCRKGGVKLFPSVLISWSCVIGESRSLEPVGLAYQITPKFTAQSAFGLFFNPNEGGIWGYAGTNPPFLLSESYVVPCSLPSYSAASENCSIPGLSILSQGFPVDALTNANTPTLPPTRRI